MGGGYTDGDEHTRAAISQLLNKLALPLEAAINILYLMRVTAPHGELHDRLVSVAEQKLQDIVEIMKKSGDAD